MESCLHKTKPNSKHFSISTILEIIKTHTIEGNCPTKYPCIIVQVGLYLLQCDETMKHHRHVAGSGSLTVLKRSSSRGSNTSRTSSQVSLESEGYASIDLGTEKLPPIDTPEASHVCSLR